MNPDGNPKYKRTSTENETAEGSMCTFENKQAINKQIVSLYSDDKRQVMGINRGMYLWLKSSICCPNFINRLGRT